MKKSIIASFFAIVLLSACKETETTTVDITGTATIQGTVLADTEKVNTPFESEALSGVVVRVLWDSEDLAVISDGDNIRRSLTDSTDSNGDYSIEVPTIQDGVNFTVEFDEFKRDVRFFNGTDTLNQNVTFQSATQNVTVRTGEVVNVDQDYEDNFKAGSELDEFGTIAGMVMADLEQLTTKGISEAAPGVTVTVEWTDTDGNELSLNTTTGTNGEYSIEVPLSNVNGDDFTVIFEEYEATVNYFNGIQNVNETLTFTERTFTNVAVKTGETEEQDHDYLNNIEGGLNEIAVLTGVVEANSERINTPLLLEAASGATVTIKYEDENTGADVEIVTTTNASGVYRVELPLNEVEDDEVDIDFEEFTTGVNYNDGFRDVTNFSATFNDGSVNNQSLAFGTETEVDFNYGSSFKDELPTFARIGGTFVVRTNAIVGSEVNTPVSNVSIRISWIDDDGIRRGEFVTTNGSGEYSLEVNLAESDGDQFFVLFPEVVISDYRFTNATPEDVTGTATYNEIELSTFLSAGEDEDEFDREDLTPDNVEEN
ncbi:MAG: hypothetical protein AAFY41_08705, partial [Bacteroidota bacterium]